MEADLDFQLGLVGLDCPEALDSLQVLVGLVALAPPLDLLALMALARAQAYPLTLLLGLMADP